MIIQDQFTFYTYIIRLQDPTASAKIFKKLNCTIVNICGLPVNIVLDLSSRYTSKLWFC